MYIIFILSYPTSHQLISWFHTNPKSLTNDYVIFSDHDEEVNTSYSYRNKGTCIIIRKIYALRINKQYRLQGRLTALLLKCRNNEHLLICSIYFPADATAIDEILFLQSKLTQILNDIPVDTHTIIAGDWNNVFNPSLDRYSTHKQYTQTRPEHKLLTRLTGPHRRIPLIDVYRLTHPTSKQFSHIISRTENETQIVYKLKSRIDFFLISNNLLERTTYNDIINSTCIDENLAHHIIALNIKLPGTQTNINYKNHKKTTTTILFNKATDEKTKLYSSAVFSNQLVIASNALNNACTNNIALPTKYISDIYRHFISTIKQAATQHIPIRRHFPNSNRKHYSKITNPNEKLKKAQTTISKGTRFLLYVRRKIKHSHVISDLALTRIQTLATEFNIIPNHNTTSNTISLILHNMKTQIRQIAHQSLQ